jgi:hypothetical protein
MRVLFFLLALILLSSNAQANNLKFVNFDFSTTDDSTKINPIRKIDCEGCIELLGEKTNLDYDLYDSINTSSNKIAEEIFSSCNNYFNKINASESTSVPKMGKISFLSFQYGLKYDYYFDTLAAKNLDTCLFRLQNIGALECYYFLAESTIFSYGVYGNLALINPITLETTVVNIFHQFGGDQNVKNRYFKIKGNKILIYDGWCYDTGCGLKYSGKLKIKRNKIKAYQKLWS